MGRQILVVERKKIFPVAAFQGFLPLHYTNIVSVINKEYSYKERTDELENDPSYLQIIPYVWLINPQTKQAFIYRRAPSKSEYKEKRHLNKISGGVGGHIDKEETQPADPIMDAAIRELHEEVVMTTYPDVTFIGYINDDSNRFSEVHLGIVGIAKTTESAMPADGMAEGAFHSIEDIEKLFADPSVQVESWTQMTWPIIRDTYLKAN